jgi:hypothetical protein
MEIFTEFLCPSVLHARHIGHNRIHKPLTIARRFGPRRPHKECKDAAEDVIFSAYFHASGVNLIVSCLFPMKNAKRLLMGVETPIPPWGLLPPPRRAPRGGFHHHFFETGHCPAVPCKGRLGAEFAQRYTPSMGFSSFLCEPDRFMPVSPEQKNRHRIGRTDPLMTRRTPYQSR